ncbi:MAG: cynR [Deltaproteobacteria bacterium]|nr:cynR [Deltaproteobacteria bacterium]
MRRRMGLSSLHLDAFFAAARALNFSQAAQDLGITQSALSQRIKALEEDLDLTVFVRLPRGVQLTEAGERLLRYCQARSSMERELLDQLTGKTSDGRLGGVLRIGGYSSVVRSILMPALGPLLRDNPNTQFHFQNAEMRELPELLLTGNVDFIVTDEPVHRADVETVELGQEEYVMCEGVQFPDPGERYLDHDPSDTTTNRFLASQDRPVPEYRRSFMDEIYAIIDGVATGLGKAVVSRHLVIHDPRIRILPNYRSMVVPVLLHHHKQPFYTALQRATIATLRERCSNLLRVGTER